MSYLYTTIAWQAPLRTAAKFVLVSLADQANDEGFCWPSVSRLCARVALSERAVQGALNELVELGYLVRHLRPSRSTYYQLLDPAASAPSTATDPAASAPSTPQHLRVDPAASAPITIKELSVESSRGPVFSAKPKKARTRKGEVTLSDWAKSVGQDQELIPADHPARKFAAAAGIPDGWVALAWKAFSEQHLTSGKRYRDWGAAFANAVRGNWMKIWFMHDDGTWRLTTAGHGLDRAMNGGSP